MTPEKIISAASDIRRDLVDTFLLGKTCAEMPQVDSDFFKAVLLFFVEDISGLSGSFDTETEQFEAVIHAELKNQMGRFLDLVAANEKVWRKNGYFNSDSGKGS